MPEQVNKFLFVILLVLAAVVSVLLFWQFPQKPAAPLPVQTMPLSQTGFSLEQEVDNIQISDLETDFRGFDADLNSL